MHHLYRTYFHLREVILGKIYLALELRTAFTNLLMTKEKTQPNAKELCEGDYYARLGSKMNELALPKP